VIRYFCDGCETEITSSNAAVGGAINNPESRLGIEIQSNGHRLKIEIMTSTDGVANAGLWCKYCILNALNKLDDRPQPKAIERALEEKAKPG